MFIYSYIYSLSSGPQIFLSVTMKKYVLFIRVTF